MKLKFSERQTTRAIYIFLILAAAILLVFLLINFSGVCAFFNTVLGILAPFLIGIVLAYLLHFPTRFFEKHLFRFVHGKKSRPKLARGLSITLSILLLLGVCTAFIVSIFPEMAANITTLVVGLPEYLKSFNQTVQNLLHSMHFSEEVIQQFALSWEDIVVQLTSYLKTTIPDLVNASIDLTVSLSNFFIGLIVSV